ncbi:hypothetical protein BV25DRAFT_1996297 [Artomyces pyxidatus]|uniref:Uncharacterized protein n=1 Tax=Artomyces pyxidatus TaxID=48021 RepID=A0ACB8SGZ4_9AGAM|nr:hypothetical protein BV25DRAFT_1996297 [Artomyces pyxidatus]
MLFTAIQLDDFSPTLDPILRVEPNWHVEDPLQQRVRVWAEEASAEREEEERQKRGTRWMDSEDMMDVDEDELELAEDSSGQSNDEEDSDEVRALKVCAFDRAQALSGTQSAMNRVQSLPGHNT